MKPAWNEMLQDRKAVRSVVVQHPLEIAHNSKQGDGLPLVAALTGVLPKPPLLDGLRRACRREFVDQRATEGSEKVDWASVIDQHL